MSRPVTARPAVCVSMVGWWCGWVVCVWGEGGRCVKTGQTHAPVRKLWQKVVKMMLMRMDSVASLRRRGMLFVFGGWCQLIGDIHNM